MSVGEPLAIAPVSESFVRSAAPRFPSPYFRRKPWLDQVLAALLLIPGVPLMACLIVLVRVTSPGPGIFSQRRVGAHGREFVMYKIRTMRIDSEATTGAVWCKVDDPRITPLGYLLRKFHLDELPQLFNVLRGEMSLVGPRPERPEFVEVLAEAIPGYRQRLLAPPGITGLAQVNFPADVDLDDVRRKLVLDLEYIERASVGFDLRLLACTLLRMCGLRGGRAVRLLGLERNVELEPLAVQALASGEATCEPFGSCETGGVATLKNDAQQDFDMTPDAVLEAAALRRPR